MNNKSLANLTVTVLDETFIRCWGCNSYEYGLNKQMWYIRIDIYDGWSNLNVRRRTNITDQNSKTIIVAKQNYPEEAMETLYKFYS